MDTHGVDVDRMAETAEGLGLVTPDCQGTDEEDEADEIVVLIHISGGLVASVGTMRRDLPRLRVIVADDDVLEDGESDGVWTEGVSALEDWSKDDDAALVRTAGELPEGLRSELGLADPS